MVLSGCRCDIIVLNVHVAAYVKSNDTKTTKELDCASDQFPNFHMKIMLGDFSADV
jgi:hypothetical protein